MTLIKLEQLTSTNNIISGNQQKKICGGFHHTESPRQLWTKYSTGTYDISKNAGNNATFTHTDADGEKRTVGKIDLDTGKLVSPPYSSDGDP
jgi:hypothetical protein